MKSVKEGNGLSEVIGTECVIPVVCVKIVNGMQSNTTVSIKVYLMATTCFGLYWPSSGCLKRT